VSLRGTAKRMHNPPHPGSVLREYLGDLPVTTAAAHLRITRVTLSRLLNGKAGISAAMAIRLAAALGNTPELWMNMQSQYDLWRARQGRQPAVRRFARQGDCGRLLQGALWKGGWSRLDEVLAHCTENCTRAGRCIEMSRLAAGRLRASLARGVLSQSYKFGKSTTLLASCPMKVTISKLSADARPSRAEWISATR
jgi:addiction module HigA family antidote